MTREVTSGEHDNMLSGRQAAQWFALVDLPAAIFKARVNQTFSSYDQVAAIIYDGVTLGAYTDILPDMTVLIGSTEGGCERGIARVRKAATGTVLYIGVESQLAIQEDDWLTVLDCFDPWAKHPKVTTNVIKMDYEIAYSNQHAEPDPMPVLGLDAIVELSGATVNVSFDASESYVVIGSGLSFLWACATAASIADEDTATPTLTFDTSGRNLVSCTVTVVATGKSYTGYRLVYVLDDSYRPLLEAEIDDPETDFETGGATLSMIVYGELSAVRPRAKVWVFSKEYLNLVRLEQGPVEGRENMVIQGWITGESIAVGTKQSASFTIEGPHAFLDKVDSMPTSLEDTDWANNGGGAPNKWSEMQTLTIRTALWHYFAWRTTLPRFTDVRIPSDTRQMAQIPATRGSIWSQIQEIAWSTIFARPACDFLGRVYVEIEPQLIPMTERNALPVIMEITRRDMADDPIIERETVAESSQITLTGAAYAAGVQAAYGGVSPGNVMGPFGEGDEIGDLVMESQAQAIALAGAYYGREINELKEISFTLAQINKFIDIAPRAYCRLSLTANENNRGLQFSDLRILPRRLKYRHNPNTGSWAVEAVFEGESQIWHGVKYIFPGSTDDGPIIEPPPIGCPPNCPPPPPDGGECFDDLEAPENGPFRIGGAAEIASNGTTYIDLPKSCWVRDKDSIYDTKVIIDGAFEQYNADTEEWEGCLTTDHITVMARLYGAVVGTAIFNPSSYGYIEGPRSAYFSADPVDGSNANIFRIEIGKVLWEEAGFLLEWIDDVDCNEGDIIYEWELAAVPPDFNAGITFKITAPHQMLTDEGMYFKIRKINQIGGTTTNFKAGPSPSYDPDACGIDSGKECTVGEIEIYYNVHWGGGGGPDLSLGAYFWVTLQEGFFGDNHSGDWEILEIGWYNRFDLDTLHPWVTAGQEARILINFVDLYNICDSV